MTFLSQDLVVGIYAIAVSVCVIIYFFLVLKICRGENISLGEAFGFTRTDKGYRLEQKHHKQVAYSVSVDEEINALYDQMNDAEGEDRMALWNRIQELKQQK